METKTVFTARYAETDQMGIVHHSNYAIWFEAGRTEFFKNAGVSNSSIEANGVLLPLYAMNCKFLSPAKYEDEIMVCTTLKSISRVRIEFTYRVVNVIDMKLIATGETMHAFTDKKLKPINAEKVMPDIYSVLINKIKK